MAKAKTGIIAATVLVLGSASAWFGGLKAIDATGINRPVLRSELKKIADVVEDTRLKVLLQLKGAEEEEIRSIQLLVEQLKAEGKTVPPVLYQNEDEANDLINGYDYEIKTLTTPEQ